MLELFGLCLACAIPNKATIAKIGFSDRSVNRTSNGIKFTCVWKMTRSLFPNVQTNNISDPVTRRSQNRERSRRPETVLSGGASLKCWKKRTVQKKERQRHFWEIKHWDGLWFVDLLINRSCDKKKCKVCLLGKKRLRLTLVLLFPNSLISRKEN